MESYPTLNFQLGDTVDLLRETVRAFAGDEIAPLASEIDQKNEFPMDLWRKMGDLGLLGITVAEEYGGAEMGYLEHVIVMEELSRASASVALSYGAHSNLCVNQLSRNGTEAQRRTYLPGLVSGAQVGALAMSEPNAGSDLANCRTRAELDGAKRKEIYTEMGTMLHEEGGGMVPMFNDFIDAVSNDVGGYEADANGELMNSYAGIRCWLNA